MPGEGNPTPGQGAGTQTDAAAAPAPVKVSPKELDEFVTRLIGRHGTVVAALTNVAGEQLRYRKRAQAAEARANELQKQLPAADAVVLVGDEAKAYKDLKAKGLTLDKVPAKFKEHEDLQAATAQQAREKSLTDTVGKKYDLDVLKRLLGEEGIKKLEFRKVNQMKEDKSGIETIEVPYITLPDNKTVEALDSYVDREFKQFAEVLKPKEGGTGSEEVPRMPKTGGQAGGTPVRGGNAEVLKVVDSQMSGFLSPSARRKAEAAESAGAK